MRSYGQAWIAGKPFFSLSYRSLWVKKTNFPTPPLSRRRHRSRNLTFTPPMGRMEARSFRNKTPCQQPRSLLRPLQHLHRYYDLVPARHTGRYQLIYYSRSFNWSHCFWNPLLDRIRKTHTNFGLEDWWSSDRLASYLPLPNPQLYV